VLETTYNSDASRAVAMILGMWSEKFIISEPDDLQIYVAITAVRNAMIEGE